MEELEVDNVAEREMPLGNDEYAEKVADEVTKNLEADEEPAESEEAPEDASDDADLNEAIESYNVGADVVLAMEDYGDEGIVKKGLSAAGGLAADAVGYLRDAGIQYGPAVLKAVGSALLFAVVKILKGLYYGEKALTKLIDESMHSYTRYYAKIAELEKAVIQLKGAGIQKATTDSKYKNEKVINNMKIGTNLAFVSDLKAYDDFVHRYVVTTSDKMQGVVSSVKTMIGQVVSNKIHSPSKMMIETGATAGFRKGNIEGYNAPDEYTEVYSYPHVLPGDLLVLAYLPKPALEDNAEIDKAYNSSTVFIGKKMSGAVGYTEAKFATLAEVETMLKLMKGICHSSELSMKRLKTAEATRNSIRFSLKGMMNYLVGKAEKNKDVLTMSRFISMKLKFMDNCYIGGSKDIENLTRKVVNNYLIYCKASLIEMSKVKK